MSKNSWVLNFAPIEGETEATDDSASSAPTISLGLLKEGHRLLLDEHEVDSDFAMLHTLDPSTLDNDL